MRVLSVVTLVSPMGEYGGPVRVAVNQARELRAKGHDVVLAGGTRGFPTPPRTVEGVPAELFPARQVVPGSGFAGLAAPSLWRWLRRHVREFDLVHVHAARDLITLPAAAIARSMRVPFVLQTHGMIDPSGRLLARPLDALLTRRLLRAARSVFYLTEAERAGLRAVAGPDLPLVELPNGVPAAEPAIGSPTGREVLYLARLAGRKRPRMFVAAARNLAAEFPDTRFTLVGPDEGEGEGVRADIAAAGLPGQLEWSGPLPPEQTLERLRRATVYVLPAVSEPYPMSVLEAMSVGLPVVVTDSCGLAGLISRSGAGLVIGESQAELDEAVRRLLADPAEAAGMGANGRQLVRTELAMAAIADRLLTYYRR